MVYEAFLTERFFSEVTTEEVAVALLWRMKNDGKEFVCPHCGGERHYEIKGRQEVRVCAACHRHIRLRAGTIFEHSKTRILLWLRAIYFVMQGKRGISAWELKRHLGMKSYGTVWAMLHKLRDALRQRDESYKLKGSIELDGATFGRRETGTEQEILVAEETKKNAQEFVNSSIESGSMINTDGSPSLRNLSGVDVDYQVVGGNKEIVKSWLPWVHKMISNSKAWVIGTHHGVDAGYLDAYLAEYFFRFNRRHDIRRLFHRAVRACLLAQPRTYVALFG
jgi:transposase-like protein